MKILFDGGSDYSFGPIQHLNFKQYENTSNNLLYCYGINTGYHINKPPKENFKYRIYFEHEEPNGFTLEGKLGYERGNWNIDYWTKIGHICPYTIDWYNNYIYPGKKFFFVPYMINPDYYFPDENKKYSVCYIGGLHGRHGIFHNVISAIKEIPGYRFLCYQNQPFVTNYNEPFLLKNKINAQTKISIIVNQLSENRPWQYSLIMSRLPYIEKNQAFTQLKNGIMPQFKWRVLEAALSKSLILCLKDEWNVIEYAFKPDVDFIYFENMDTLTTKINECLNNWDYCEKIIENAYKKCIDNYTVQAFYDKFLKKYDLNF